MKLVMVTVIVNSCSVKCHIHGPIVIKSMQYVIKCNMVIIVKTLTTNEFERTRDVECFE